MSLQLDRLSETCQQSVHKRVDREEYERPLACRTEVAVLPHISELKFRVHDEGLFEVGTEPDPDAKGVHEIDRSLEVVGTLLQHELLDPLQPLNLGAVLAADLGADHQGEDLPGCVAPPPLLAVALVREEAPTIPIVLLTRTEASRALQVAGRVLAVVKA